MPVVLKVDATIGLVTVTIPAVVLGEVVTFSEVAIDDRSVDPTIGTDVTFPVVVLHRRVRVRASRSGVSGRHANMSLLCRSSDISQSGTMHWRHRMILHRLDSCTYYRSNRCALDTYKDWCLYQRSDIDSTGIGRWFDCRMYNTQGREQSDRLWMSSMVQETTVPVETSPSKRRHCLHAES